MFIFIFVNFYSFLLIFLIAVFIFLLFFCLLFSFYLFYFLKSSHLMVSSTSSGVQKHSLSEEKKENWKQKARRNHTRTPTSSNQHGLILNFRPFFCWISTRTVSQNSAVLVIAAALFKTRKPKRTKCKFPKTTIINNTMLNETASHHNEASSSSFADGHTVSNAPDLFRPAKLSSTRPG